MEHQKSRKRLILILGPNGVGKSAVGAELARRLPKAVYFDSDALRGANPLSEAGIAAHKDALLTRLSSAFASPAFEDVIFPYGLHGHRRKLLAELMEGLRARADISVFSVILTCEEAENIRRMRADGRDEARIQRALANTRALYDALYLPKIDGTRLTVKQTADAILALIDQSPA